MPTSDLDLPLLPSSEQIRRREFATIRRGYDPDQVRDYLGSVASQVESLESDLKDARLVAESRPAQPSANAMPIAPESDPYDRISKRFAGLIAAADREAGRIVDDAKTDADRIRVDAQASAEAAKQEGTDALGSAREEADRVLTGLSTRRDQLVSQLQQMQSRLLGVAEELGSVIEGPATAGSDADDLEAMTPTQAEAMPEGSDPGELLDPRYEDLWVTDAEGSDPAEAEVRFEELFADADAEAEAGAEASSSLSPTAEDEDEDSEEISMDIPDLASLEFDFDQEHSDTSD